MVPFDVHGLGEFLRDQRRQARLSLRQLADAAGVSNPYLSQIERGLRKPSAEILQQIAKGLEISAETLYVRAGILDEEVREDQGTERPDVIGAVAADPVLTEGQKQALIEIYHSFRRAAAPAGEPADGTPTGRTGGGTATTPAGAPLGPEAAPRPGDPAESPEDDGTHDGTTHDSGKHDSATHDSPAARSTDHRGTNHDASGPGRSADDHTEE
ncbi:helix-turn-helix domain-containing protein [Streptomyces spiramenti]|uniref:Helix-turn-helix transcriptional regulator n=1 Tax=Streptomyces spiramenti TaxID=2720606 RepID=A0ABX1AMS6_9ACTN|nr:helix-turn-helix transcriptional regulator [Streptomyces spiramenti]NJP67001.1 helix-turn-helix transcriptional regulator [Streptomyces spiramenti]